jgi:hypothetical protein
MTVHGNRRRWIAAASRQAIVFRVLAAAAGLITAAATVAPPAHADPVGDSFLSALTNSGVAYGDPASTVALGQSICPLLVQPGGTFGSVASGLTGNNGMSPQMAGLFTSIAISMFCPTVISSLAGGNWLNPGPLRGL